MNLKPLGMLNGSVVYKKIDLSLDKPIQLTLNLYHEKHCTKVYMSY